MRTHAVPVQVAVAAVLRLLTVLSTSIVETSSYAGSHVAVGRTDTNAYARFQEAFNRSDVDGLRSLASSLAGVTDPSDRSLGILALAGAHFRADDMRACIYSLDSLESLYPFEDPRLLAVAHKIRAQVLLWAGDPVAGSAAVARGLLIADSLTMPEERVVLLVIGAELSIANGDHLRAYEQLTLAQRLSESSAFTRGICLVRINIGNIKYHQERYEEALVDYRATVALAAKNDWNALAQNALSNLASVAIMLERYNDASRLCDSVLHTLGPRSPELRASLLAHLGYIEREQDHQTKAIAYFNRSIALSDSIGDQRGHTRTAHHLSRSLWATGLRQRAIDLLEATLLSARRLRSARAVADIEWDLHDWCAIEGRHDQAMRYLEDYTEVVDSLNEARFSQEIARSEVLFDTERKERRLAEQEQALTLAAAEDRRKALQRNISIGVAVLLIVIAALLWRGLRMRQRLARKDQELHNEQVDQLLSAQEIKSINAMLEGQEKERDRMAKDLHDRLGSVLSSIKVNMSAMEDRLEHMRNDQQYHKVNRLLDEAVSELRRISHDMAAGTLSRFGLEKALMDLRDTVHISGRLAVELKVFGLEHRLERAVEIAAYRILQELVSNVLKHAKAREMSISVTRSPGRLSLMVTDDGIGFDPADQHAGIGSENVRSRAASLGGTVQVDSQRGKGTTVSIECPIIE